MRHAMPPELRLHVALDYLLVAAGLLAPWVLGFSHHTAATVYALGLALFGLGLNLVTDYPGGLWKQLPFAWHRWVEWAAPPAFIVVPWWFFSDAGAMPVFLTVVGLAIALNATLAAPRRA
jgi:hypothetical protein